VETATALLQRMPRMVAAAGARDGLAPLGQVHASAVELMRHRERWREHCVMTLQDESLYDGCPVPPPPPHPPPFSSRREGVCVCFRLVGQL
jgi:hypothetical protein